MAKAIELAGAEKIVIACNGTYDEQLAISAGTKLYGGFSCPGSATPWSYEAGTKAKVAPSTKGIALSITAGAAAVAIEDFEFDAKDGVGPSESSIAAFVNASTEVALTRVKLVAGKGADGANGTLTKVTKFPTQLELNGHAAAGNTGGDLNAQTCVASGSTTGASGGNGGTGALTSGGTGAPDLGMGKGGVAGSCSPNGTGQDGANAPPTPPALGAAKLGTITLAGWIGVAGSDGTPGGPGQGGGGGAGSATSGGGGGGGAGGCGGAGGTGGKAGGSSIALLLLNSSPVLTASELVAANAGRGGAGVAGQDAQPEFGNAGPFAGGGCGGGKGGLGASGGAGGGAAGGISVGIAYQVMQDMTLEMPDSATTIITGLAGAAGIGGVPGTNDGIAGVKQDVLQMP